MTDFLHPKKVAQRIKSHHDFMWDYFTDLLRSLFRPAMIFLFFLGMAVILAFAGLFYHVEKDHNPAVTSYFDAVYFSMSTMTTVGFGDISPQTVLGKSVAMVMMLIGTGLFVSYTALISFSILTIEENRRNKKD